MLLLTTAIVFALAVFHGLSVPQGINADAFYPLTFVGDLGRHEPLLWSVPPANFFFPDVFVTGLGYVAGLRGFDNIVLGYGFECAAIFIAGYALLRAGGLGHLPSLVAAMLAVCAAAIYEGGSTILAHTLIVPAHHAGVIALQLAAAALYLRYVKSPARRAGIALAAIVAVAVLSDRITLAQFVAPALAGLIWVAGSERKTVVRDLGVALGAGALAGWLAIWLIDRSGWIHHSNVIPLWEGGVGALLHRVKLSLLQVPAITGIGGAVLFGGSYLALVALAVAAMRSKRGPFSTLVVFAALLSTASLLTPVVSGLWIDAMAIRYQLPFFIIPLLTIAGLLLQMVEVPRPERWAAASFGLLAALAIAVSVAGPHGVEAADAVAFGEFDGLSAALARDDPPAVFSQYWVTKPVLYLSGERVKACSITDAGEVDPFIANLSWCVDAIRALRSAPPTLVPFVDYLGRFNQPDLRSELGPPSKSVDVAGFRVTYYPSSVVREKLGASLCSALRAYGRPDAMEGCRIRISAL
jgi:hypothetical protein